jgi:hypothetical protein
MFKSLSPWIPEKAVRNDRFSGDENKLGRWGSGLLLLLFLAFIEAISPTLA